MRLCEERTLQIVHLTLPGSEFHTKDHLRDAHTTGFLSLMHEAERYPNLCYWEESKQNILADIERCSRGWDRDPAGWAAECLTLRANACANVLALSHEEFSRRMPDDLKEYWSTHYED